MRSATNIFFNRLPAEVLVCPGENHGNSYTFAEAIRFVENAKEAFDLYYYISRGGVPPRGKNWDGSDVPAAPAAPEEDPAVSETAAAESSE